MLQQSMLPCMCKALHQTQSAQQAKPDKCTVLWWKT